MKNFDILELDSLLCFRNLLLFLYLNCKSESSVLYVLSNIFLHFSLELSSLRIGNVDEQKIGLGDYCSLSDLGIFPSIDYHLHF